jgi:hypothetical protein
VKTSSVKRVSVPIVTQQSEVKEGENADRNCRVKHETDKIPGKNSAAEQYDPQPPCIPEKAFVTIHLNSGWKLSKDVGM